jgi:hypothetical protein
MAGQAGDEMGDRALTRGWAIALAVGSGGDFPEEGFTNDRGLIEGRSRVG